MAERVFNFISPGVEVQEIDNTGRPGSSEAVGPVIIGRAERGPGLVPVTVESFSEFIQFFGDPFPGGQGGDVWREGNRTSPSYGAFAMRAWLKNAAPATFIRLLGASHTDATAAGEAGWETKDGAGNATGLGSEVTDGGAYGLFIMDSGSFDQGVTGTLAAVWYLNQGSIALSGTVREDGNEATGSALFVESIGDSKEFKAIIRDSDDNVVKETSFNFNQDSRRFIRKVFNVNPTLANSSITDAANLKNYWLGETFENVLDTYVTSSGAGSQFGVILGLKGPDSTQQGSDHRKSSTPPQTGWFIGQDLNVVSGSANSYDAGDMPKLFKLHGRNAGAWMNRGIKVSIEDIRPSTNPQNPYGTFTVTIRRASDRDTAREIVERFANCNLNPASNNYISKKIGDKYDVWDDSERRYTTYGQYDNLSRFVRVEVNPSIDNAALDAELLPFGVFGPVRHRGFTLISGSATVKSIDDITSDFTASFVKGGELPISQPTQTTNVVDCGNGPISASFIFPATTLRSSADDGNLANPTEAYFGLQTDATAGSRYDKGYPDLVRGLPGGYDSFTADGEETEYQWIFSLDEISGSGTTSAVYSSGSRAAGTSFTAVHGDYRRVIQEGFDRFTAPVYGGFDGLDVTESDPFRNTLLEGGSTTTNYAFNSIKRAIDAVSDPEDIQMSMITVPGLKNSALTNHVANVAAQRKEVLAIIDLEGDYVPESENTATEANRLGSVRTTIDNLDTRGIDNEYACAYYPWLRYRDETSGQSFWGPPSIAAIGVHGYTEARSEPFFAPAGSRRGALNSGEAGIPVVGVREVLRKKERDQLYEARINPIANFPGGDIVVYGQKTLLGDQEKVSSRINVKKLTNMIKRRIKVISARYVFEQNLPETWAQLRGEMDRYLRDIQARLGIEDYSFVLDNTTTTPELRDRNILYAKLFIVPTKAIEHVRIEMTLSNSGVGFDE